MGDLKITEAISRLFAERSVYTGIYISHVISPLY